MRIHKRTQYNTVQGRLRLRFTLMYANYVQRKAFRVGVLAKNRCTPSIVSNKMLYRMMFYHVRFDTDDIASEHRAQNIEGCGKRTENRRDGTQ